MYNTTPQLFWAIAPDRSLHHFWVMRIPGSNIKPARVKYGELSGNKAVPEETKTVEWYIYIPLTLGNQLQHILGYDWTVLAPEQVLEKLQKSI